MEVVRRVVFQVLDVRCMLPPLSSQEILIEVAVNGIDGEGRSSSLTLLHHQRSAVDFKKTQEERAIPKQRLANQQNIDE